jgi:RNA polymerase sigma-70 factor, ECF subfamily
MKDLPGTGHSRSDAMPGPELAQPADAQAARVSLTVPTRAGASTADFNDLYDEHFAAVWRMLQALGVARAALDDAVQDVFLSAYRQLAHFEGRSTMRTWLCGIACHVAANYRRREKRKGGLSPLDNDAWSDQAPGPLEQLEQTQAWAMVSAFLEQLDADKRATYVLSRIEGLTAPEIAQALQIPVNTVYSRLHAVQAHLQKFMATKGIKEALHG